MGDTGQAGSAIMQIIQQMKAPQSFGPQQANQGLMSILGGMGQGQGVAGGMGQAQGPGPGAWNFGAAPQPSAQVPGMARQAMPTWGQPGAYGIAAQQGPVAANQTFGGARQAASSTGNGMTGKSGGAQTTQPNMGQGGPNRPINPNQPSPWNYGAVTPQRRMY